MVIWYSLCQINKLWKSEILVIPHILVEGCLTCTIIFCVFETLTTELLFSYSLRLALLNEAKEVRAAGLRALRYLIQDSSILQKVLKLKVDYLIAR